MSGLRLLAVVLLGIAFVSALEASRTYRECRHVYKFEHAFCASVFFK